MITTRGWYVGLLLLMRGGHGVGGMVQSRQATPPTTTNNKTTGAHKIRGSPPPGAQRRGHPIDFFGPSGTQPPPPSSYRRPHKTHNGKERKQPQPSADTTDVVAHSFWPFRPPTTTFAPPPPVHHRHSAREATPDTGPDARTPPT